MGRMKTFQPAPPATVSRVLATFDRDQLAGFIAVAIDLLDLADGDLDIEPNGDELDDTGGEDGFFPHGTWRAEPGCPISDPDFGADDEGENRTWIETTDQRRIGDYALTCAAMDDDAEEDDDPGQCTEDEISCPTHWFLAASGPGCAISDNDHYEMETWL